MQVYVGMLPKSRAEKSAEEQKLVLVPYDKTAFIPPIVENFIITLLDYEAVSQNDFCQTPNLRPKSRS